MKQLLIVVLFLFSAQSHAKFTLEDVPAEPPNFMFSQKNNKYIKGPILEYDIESPANMKINFVSLNADEFQFYNDIAGIHDYEQYYIWGRMISFTWPDNYFSKDGPLKFYIYSEKKELLFVEDITDRRIDAWGDNKAFYYPDQFLKNQTKVIFTKKDRNRFGQTKVGFFVHPKHKAYKMVEKGDGYFCLNQKNANGDISFCQNNRDVKKFTNSAAIWINNKENTKEKDTLNYQFGQNSLEIMTSSGKRLKVNFYVPESALLDVVKKDNDFSQLIFEGPCTSEQTPLNPSPYWIKILGFDDTIKDPKGFCLSTSLAESYQPAQDSMSHPYVYKYSRQDIASEDLRPKLEKSFRSTYKKNLEQQLEFAEKPKSLKVSGDGSITERDGGYIWNFKNLKIHKTNKGGILINDKHYAEHSVFRAPSIELAARITQSADDNLNTYLIQESAGSWWLESIFGSKNDRWSFQRWGATFKQFQTLDKLKNDDGDELFTFHANELDIKYRLDQGVWGFDETLGLIASYQMISYDDNEFNMPGVGAFWARSMPKTFDDVFNWLPFFRYPKWVDMEAIYFYSQEVQSFILNFHGKIIWSQYFFGEAGFGLKTYTVDSETNKFDTIIAYGTVGLGINF